jgi:hypothetical protein
MQACCVLYASHNEEDIGFVERSRSFSLTSWGHNLLGFGKISISAGGINQRVRFRIFWLVTRFISYDVTTSIPQLYRDGGRPAIFGPKNPAILHRHHL